MKQVNLEISFTEITENEWSDDDRELLNKAKEAAQGAYVPYSQFSVGAALRLSNGKIFVGSNQENAAYPSGLCAERTAIFGAAAVYPNEPVETLVVVAKTVNGYLQTPIPPCGQCRQVMLEVEHRYNSPVRLLLYGAEKSYVIDNASDLLPIQFTDDYLKQ